MTAHSIEAKRATAARVLAGLAGLVAGEGVTREEVEAAVLAADPDAVPSGNGWILHLNGSIASVLCNDEMRWYVNEFGWYSDDTDVEHLRRVARAAA